MSWILRGVLLGTLAGSLVVCLPPSSPAQADKNKDKAKAKDKDKDEKVDKDPVRFYSADGVTLRGSFYKSKAGTDTPVVILMHNYGAGQDSTKGGLDDLAVLLQKKCTVLTFDFRGHGLSTEIVKDFWSYPHNKNHVRGNPNKTTIAVKDFDTSYYPVLVNDIAAARTYLDLRNDDGACNTSKLFIMGVQQSVPVGWLWIATEWQRPAVAPSPVAAPGKTMAGEDVTGAIWLSPSNDPPGRVSIPYSKLVNDISPDMKERTPTCFLYSENDGPSKASAEYFFKNILRADTKSGPKLTFNHPIKGASKLAGAALLDQQNQTGADVLVDKFIDAVMESKGNPARVVRGYKQPWMPDLNRFGINIR